MVIGGGPGSILCLPPLSDPARPGIHAVSGALPDDDIEATGPKAGDPIHGRLRGGLGR